MNAAAVDTFVPNPAQPGGSADPVFGQVRQGWLNSMWPIENPRLGLAQLTGGSRLVTPFGDGVVSESRGWFRRRSPDRHLALGDHRYSPHHTSLRRAKLLRDGAAIGWLRRTHTGRLFHGGWLRTYEVVRWGDQPDPAGVAIG